MPNLSVILAAAGKSSRFNHPTQKKTFITLNSKAVWLHSAELLLQRSDVKQMIVVVAPEDREEFVARFGPNMMVLDIDIASGGQERSDSIQNALQLVKDQCEYVLIHDAARPCIDSHLIDSVVEAAVQHQAAIPAIPVHSTLKRSGDGKFVDETQDRSGLYLAQTPQVFHRQLLMDAFAQRGDFQPTDEAQLLERAGVKVALVKGSPLNIKITQRADLAMAKACLAALPKPRFDAPPNPFADDNLFR